MSGGDGKNATISIGYKGKLNTFIQQILEILEECTDMLH